MRDLHGTRLLIPAALVALITLSACHRVDENAEAAAVLRIVGAAPAAGVSADTWQDVRTFYEARQNTPAWDTSAAVKVRDVLRTARVHGLVPADYHEPELATEIEALTGSKSRATGESERTAQLADLDVRLTTALMAFGRDVALGRTRPTALDPRWKARREKPDFASTLAEAGGDPQKWVDAVRPRHPEYAALEQAMSNLLGERDKGGWEAVALGKGAKLAPGRSSPAMVALRQRLAAGGFLRGDAVSNTSLAYSKDDQAAVRAFQDLHAIKASGMVDAPTLAAMNVPIDERIRQVALNLERWRWMPDDFGPRHLIVNIPYFHLVAREDGKAVADIRVVVGKPTDQTRTPVFSSAMTTVVLAPYWNIPDSIVEGETAPAVARDPKYLERNHIEILDVSRNGATPVAYNKVHWDDADQMRHLAFRQLPGPGNALGHVKFLFPNPFDVYLHDTPADELFARPGRAFSHGCVRVEEPEALAKYVLRGHPGWSDDAILEAMNAGIEKPIKLREPIPVHIVYFTAWVDENSGLHFQPDIYGYDAVQR